MEKNDMAPVDMDTESAKADESGTAIAAINGAVDLTQGKARAPIIVTSTIVGSGKYIEMYRLGTSAKVSPLVTEHKKIGERLAVVESKLRACNEAHTLAEFEQYCRTKGKDFPALLRRLAWQLERKKLKLGRGLRRIIAQLSYEEPALAESMRSCVYALNTPVSLIPMRHIKVDPEIEARDKFIAGHSRSEVIDICRKLDLKFQARYGDPTRTLPETWFEHYGVKTFTGAYENHECRPLVGALICKAKKKYPTTYLPS